MSAANKDLVRRGLEEPWRNPAVLDELVSDDYVGHDPASPEPFRGVEGAKQNVEMYRSAFEGAQIRSSSRSPKAISSRRAGKAAGGTPAR